MKRNYLCIVLVFALFGIAANVLGDNVTSWDVTPGGTVGFSAGSEIASTNLPVGSVQLVADGVPATTLSITSGLLSFSDPTYNGDANGVLSWGAGGSLMITGCTSVDGCVTLMSDDFQSVTVDPINGTSFAVTFGQVSGTIDSGLANYFGIGQDFAASSFDLTLDGNNNLGGTISAAAVSASEDWSLSTSLMFLALVGATLGILARARVLHVVLHP